MGAIECQTSLLSGSPPWPVVEPADFADEQMGTKEKFWLGAPDGTRWLFKFARHHEQVNGADWAEVLVHVVANGLGLPSACVRLATYQDVRGIMVRSVLDVDAGEDLVVRRGKSHHFAGKPSLVRVAAEALKMCGAESREGMLRKLQAFDLTQLAEAASRLPDEVMSVAQRRLVVRIVEVNRRRLFDEFAD